MSTAAALSNGRNLAYWLLKVHPQIYAALAAQAPRLSARLSRFGRLGDDISVTDVGTTTTFDTSALDSGISPDLVSLPPPALEDVSISTPDISSEVSSSIDASVLSPSLSSSGGGGSFSSVASWLSSATGLTSLTNLATAIYKSGSPQAATIGTQVARVQAGSSPAPITYTLNSSGQLVPVLAKAGSTPTLLSASGLQNLIPSNLSQYAIPIGLGVVGLLWALGSRRGSK